MADQKPKGNGGKHLVVFLLTIASGCAIGQVINDHTDKRWHWPIAGGGAIVALVLLWWWRRRSSTSRRQ